jgi:hypothetical protein
MGIFVAKTAEKITFCPLYGPFFGTMAIANPAHIE